MEEKEDDTLLLTFEWGFTWTKSASIKEGQTERSTYSDIPTASLFLSEARQTLSTLLLRLLRLMLATFHREKEPYTSTR